MLIDVFSVGYLRFLNCVENIHSSVFLLERFQRNFLFNFSIDKNSIVYIDKNIFQLNTLMFSRRFLLNIERPFWMPEMHSFCIYFYLGGNDLFLMFLVMSISDGIVICVSSQYTMNTKFNGMEIFLSSKARVFT